eukprot:scaffold123936_cov69-Phaeocystis_antarctica.AAC.1
MICAAGDSPPSDQVARRLLRADVRRCRNLAVVTCSRVQRGHDRRRRRFGVGESVAGVRAHSTCRVHVALAASLPTMRGHMGDEQVRASVPQ